MVPLGTRKPAIESRLDEAFHDQGFEDLAVVHLWSDWKLLQVMMR
jgi:hypothetical protein